MTIYQRQLTEFSRDFQAGATTGIILSSGLGSIAAMLVLMNGHEFYHMIQLGLIVVVAMWYNAAVLSQLSPKFVFNSLILSLGVSSIFILLNLLS
ncbi:MAG: hypothetical protein VX712_08630 [Bacteroidota bacterium]|uniref:Uncharacterized protein n=1 Tax=Christiangramia flava JLT2011 TaxID=1229726 RepID=A0A1L7I5F8_9FLAO|nr:hypothetical protein [Christiangramia flava]APU68332.1 hypothetical protein GRFL_1608 [Christiangramia flava JLT2011]MAM18975.1 hypothetical protein [Christiangramia sp.]MEE2772270.1 hypothetical protein [Bacteroidota bacterium]OSS40881.1 hypothetical protein C723_0290 [Christiangramia flava JLT2011]